MTRTEAVPARGTVTESSRVAVAALAAGVSLLALLWLGPLPDMARRAFSLHMILHLGVTVVAAPLIALGLVGLGRNRTVRRPIALALGASLFEMLVVWGWHAPALHEAAAARLPAFVAQQASFFCAGLLIWATAFASSGGTALPICLKAGFIVPLNTKPSGNDCNRAASLTEIVRACALS